jgi:hypothetical protein
MARSDRDRLQSEQTTRVAFAVCVENFDGAFDDISDDDDAATRALKQFYEPFLVVNGGVSQWAKFSLVDAQVALLRFARRQFAKATRLLLTSGDSVPTKPPLQMLVTCQKFASILGFHDDIGVDNNVEWRRLLPLWVKRIYQHSQWTLLTAEHADEIVKVQIDAETWQALRRFSAESGVCCRLVPDEWVFGTVVRNRCQQRGWLFETLVMEHDFDESDRSCDLCARRLSSARVYDDNIGTLQRKFRESWLCPSTFVMRKVSTPTTWQV